LGPNLTGMGAFGEVILAYAQSCLQLIFSTLFTSGQE